MSFSEKDLGWLRKKPVDQLTRDEQRFLLFHPTQNEIEQYRKMNREARTLFALNLREMEREENEPQPEPDKGE